MKDESEKSARGHNPVVPIVPPATAKENRGILPVLHRNQEAFGLARWIASQRGVKLPVLLEQVVADLPNARKETVVAALEKIALQLAKEKGAKVPEWIAKHLSQRQEI